MQTIKINMVTSRLCNPKVENKLEPSHRELQKKLHYDQVNPKSKGVNWIKKSD